MTSVARERVRAGGRTLTLTNLDKRLYPETGTTKRDILRYCSESADVMLVHTRDRPATRTRWVDGVGTAGHPRLRGARRDERLRRGRRGR